VVIANCLIIGRIARDIDRQCGLCSDEAIAIMQALGRYLRAALFWFWICVGILLAFTSYNSYGSGFGAAMFGATSYSAESPVGTKEDRKRLVDYLIAKTMEREAFSPVKNERLNLDVEAAMRAYEDEVVAAETEQELFYALAKLSNARHDRHLYIWPIWGGIAAPKYYRAVEEPPEAPIGVDIDYSDTENFILFVSDVATNASLPSGVQPGVRIRSVNGVSAMERFEQTRPFYHYSTEHGYRKKFSQRFNTRTGLLPPELYKQGLELRLERKTGEVFDVTLPYVNPESIKWVSDSADRYPGFKLVADRGAFDLYLSTKGRQVLVIDWHRFNGFLVKDMDWLMEYASDNGLLDHDIIWDGTRSGGGKLGVYAIQRLSPKPFKTTFGNLRISDVIPAFIAERVETYEAKKQMLDSRRRDIIDDGTWLIDWLTNDVQKAYAAGQEYTNNVPYRLAHAPKHSDGIIYPAAIHFRGNMVCLMGPNGGSYLDQFYAIVTDNDLCRTIGMQTGGYSHTWVWKEEVVFETTGKPVVQFMWNIGHTISPNGKILEGDPAEIGEFIPLTRENFAEYDQILLRRALSILEEQE